MDVGYLLGIDIGTSGCKIAVFTINGEVVFQCTEIYETFHLASDCVEQNPKDWWQAVCNGTQRLFAETKIQPEDIKGIGVGGQSWAMIPVDKNGVILRNAMIWMDRRSVKQCDELKSRIDEEIIFAVAGNPLSPSYTTGKILWMKENEPELYRKTYKILQCNSYIVYKLTDQFTQDLSQGNGIHAFNIDTGRWDFSLCEQMGIRPDLLPDIYGCSEVIGGVSNRASQESGLNKGTPVVSGGLDAACGTFGAGVIHRGQTQEQGGQAGGMSIVLDKAVKNKKLILSYHVVEGKWLLQGGTVGGGSLKWIRNILEDPSDNMSSESFFEKMNVEAERIKTGSDGLIFLPYMAGERSPIWDVNAKGVFLGLSYEKTRAHIIHAIMEGCAFALYHNLQTAESDEVSIHELYSMGGAANSQLWTQIKANVTGKTVKVPASDTATTLGAALLAGVGVGMYKDFTEAIQKCIIIRRTHEPDLNEHLIYRNIYEIYIETYERLKDLFPRLGK